MMSHENVEVIRRAVEAVNRRDADAFVATASPDVEWQGLEAPYERRGSGS